MIDLNLNSTLYVLFLQGKYDIWNVKIVQGICKGAYCFCVYVEFVPP